jgi:TonB family protein
VAREIVQRVRTRGTRLGPDWTRALIALGPAFPPSLGFALTAAERKAMKQAGFAVGDTMNPPSRSRYAAQRDAGIPARMAQPVVPGLLAGLLAQTGCAQTRRDSYVSGAVVYRPDGRPQRIMLGEGLGPLCTPALQAVLSLTLADTATVIASHPADVVFLPLRREMLACIDLHPAGDAVPVGMDGLSMPQLKREIRPTYPERARLAGIQGDVLLEAVVSSTGCVSYGRVIRQLHPDLDLEALATVLHWRFRPALLAGQPVPILVTVGVSFNLTK